MSAAAEDDIRYPELEPSQRLTAELVALRYPNPAMARLFLKPAAGEPGLAYKPGQFVRLAFPGLPRRDYSIAGPPGRDHLEFLIRVNEFGIVSDYLRERAQPGDRITVEGPFGEAHLKPQHTEPILAIAGGSGVAPMKAIVEDALQRGHEGPIILYFGARTESDILLEDEFEAMARRYEQFAYVPVLSDDPEAKGRRTGQVGKVAAADHLDLSEMRVFMAGPPAMVDASLPLLKAKGATDARLHTDAF